MKSFSIYDRAAVLSLAIFAIGCTEPVAPVAITPLVNPRAVAVCNADLRAQTLTCTDARVNQTFTSGLKKDVIVGGQDVFVRLSSSGTAYDGGTQIFSSNVDVQNLLKYSMGSSDGSTVTGIDVFFQSGPTVTDGTGSVTLANPDGMGPFTGPNQPYYQYGQILSPFEISAARSWQFQISGVVNTFSFQVYVSSALVGPETGILGNIWNGSASSAWANPANWRDNSVPDSGTTVTIPTDSLLTTHTYPIIASDVSVTNLRVGSGSTLCLGGFRMIAYGNVESLGTVTDGTIRMPGAGALLGGTVNALEISGSVKLQRATTATGALSVSDGTLTVADKALTISLQ
jgi:hypothetical protein